VKHYSNLTLQLLLFIGKVHKAQNHWFWPLCCLLLNRDVVRCVGYCL